MDYTIRRFLYCAKYVATFSIACVQPSRCPFFLKKKKEQVKLLLVAITASNIAHSSLRSKRSRANEELCVALVKILAARKLGREQQRKRSREGVLPHPLPAPFPFLLSPQFSRD